MINLEDFLIVNKLPGCMLVRDLQGRYLGVSRLANKLMLGWNSAEKAIGTSYSDAPNFLLQAAKITELSESHLHKTGKVILSLAVINSLDYYHVMIIQRSLIKNGRNQSVAIFVNCIDITNYWLSKNNLCCDASVDKEALGLIQETGLYILQDKYNDFQLNTVEENILFFLIRNYRINHMANVFNVSNKKIRTIVGGMEDKFLCNSRAELIEKIRHSNFSYYIPKKFLYFMVGNYM